jgi:hypothetical protein
MVELIVGIIAIYLYYLLIRWVFLNMVPFFVCGALIIGVITITVAYGKTLYDVFNMKDRFSLSRNSAAENAKRTLRGIAFAILGLLLFLMFHDILDITLTAFFNIVSVSLLNKTSVYHFFFVELWEAFQITDLSKYLGLPPYPTPWMMTIERAIPLVIIRLGVKMTCVILLALYIRGMQSLTQGPAGGEPAKLQYYFHDAFKIDLLNTPKVLYQTIVARPLYVFNRMRLYFNAHHSGKYGFLMFVAWPIPVSVAGIFLMIAAVATPTFIFLLALHFVIIAAILLVFFYIAFFLFALERIVLFIRSGYAKCPYHDCHARITLPAYVCPNCGALHKRLIPGKYGVLERECDCGFKLPTFAWLGKDKLPQRCPSCDHEIHEKLFASNVHIPIYGGPSSGKTSFMLACLYQLFEHAPAKLKTEFIYQKDADNYEHLWRPAFESGRMPLVAKTTEEQPDAFLLSMRRNSGLPVSVYFYDPAGEALQNENALSKHAFLKFFDGLALIIDPFSLPSVGEALTRAGKTLPTNVSQLDPREFLDRTVSGLERVAGLKRTKKFPKKIAVIVNKTDDPFIQKELGLRPEDNTRLEDWGKISETTSPKIEEWLRINEPGIYQLITTRFSDTRFFSVSSLGEDPKAGKAHSPKGAINPFLWLVSKRKVLSAPKLVQILGKLAEVVAVMMIFSLFFIGPFALTKAFHAYALPLIQNSTPFAAFRTAKTVQATKPAPVSTPANTSKPVAGNQNAGAAKASGRTEPDRTAATGNLESATINGDSVRIRSAPDTSRNDNIVFRANKGHSIKIISSRQVKPNETWLMVEYQAGKRGWVRSDLVKRSSGTPF